MGEKKSCQSLIREMVSCSLTGRLTKSDVIYNSEIPSYQLFSIKLAFTASSLDVV